jgi:imidazolonepropionase-like amidohydrolase
VLTMNERVGVARIIKDDAVFISNKNIVEVGSYKDLTAQYQ